MAGHIVVGRQARRRWPRWIIANRKSSNHIEKSEGDTSARARSGFLSGRSCRDVVELCGHDEVVLVQAFDLLRFQGDGHVAPAEADVGVMTLGFRKIGHLPDEGKRLREVPELERSLNPPRLVLNTPLRRLTLMSADFVRRKGWNAASTWSAGFRREG
jgi:hypothetical protein